MSALSHAMAPTTTLMRLAPPDLLPQCRSHPPIRRRPPLLVHPAAPRRLDAPSSRHRFRAGDGAADDDDAAPHPSLGRQV